MPGQWKAIWGARLRWLGVIIVLSVVSGGLYEGKKWLFEPSRFPLRHVRIHGKLLNLNQADVEKMVQNYLGQSFFALDINTLHASFAANPWVDKVSVRRLWPDTLEIRVQERTAFGFWGEEEMVDINGKRFRPTTLRQPGLWPRLIGPDGHEMNLIRVWREAEAVLNKIDLQLVRLVLDRRRAWSMQFANGIEINLGRENFAQRLQRFLDIYPLILANQSDKIAVVDLRYTNGFAVRWTNSPKPDSTTPSVTRAIVPMHLMHHQAARATNSAG
jgi:cell division protein FtsQ